MSAEAPLDGIRVLDLSERSVAAANTGMLLADLGAEVIRVEPEQGDPIRALPGSRVWLRGQRSVLVNEDDLLSGRWARLRDTADVVLQTAQPWSAKPHGLLSGWDVDGAQILAGITGEPLPADRDLIDILDSPRPDVLPAYAEILEARWGHQVASNPGYRPGPIFLGFSLAAYGAAWMSTIGILAAIYRRYRTGYGQITSTSLVDGLAILGCGQWLRAAGFEPMPLIGGPTKPPARRSVVSLFECADGVWIHTNTGPRGSFNRLMKLLGREDLVYEGMVHHGSDPLLDPAEAQALWDFVHAKFKSQPSYHWVEALNAIDVPCMPALQPGEALSVPQIEANDLVEITSTGERMLGKIATFDVTPMTIRHDVPKVGADCVLLDDPAREPVKAPGGPAPNGEGPLDGLTVVDLGIYMAGPFGSRLLADLGARVVKVEEVGGETMRGASWMQVVGFRTVARGKEVIGINLKDLEGRAAIHDLVSKADIVHHNMRSAALGRLGVDYSTLTNLNANLIYCHATGYGNRGPWATFPTLEPLHSALTGLLTRVAGAFNQPAGYLSHLDYGAGLTSAVATIAALVARERTGRGQHVEVPQTGAGLFVLSDVFQSHGEIIESFGIDYDQRGPSATNALYRTADGWVAIACYSQEEWELLHTALGLPQTVDYDTARKSDVGSEAGLAIDKELVELTAVWVKEVLDAAGVACEIPVRRPTEEVVEDSHLRDLGIIVDCEHPKLGHVLEVGHTVRFSRDALVHRRSAPMLGEHTQQLLYELGRSKEDIERLAERGAVRLPDGAVPSSAATKEHE